MDYGSSEVRGTMCSLMTLFMNTSLMKKIALLIVHNLLCRLVFSYYNSMQIVGRTTFPRILSGRMSDRVFIADREKWAKRKLQWVASWKGYFKRKRTLFWALHLSVFAVWTRTMVHSYHVLGPFYFFLERNMAFVKCLDIYIMRILITIGSNFMILM